MEITAVARRTAVAAEQRGGIIRGGISRGPF